MVLTYGTMLAAVSNLILVVIVARSISILEVSFSKKESSFVTNFILLIFFPIGLYFLQPKMNRIVESVNNRKSRL